MKLKKPAKDHRGSWALVLDNEGTMVAAVKYMPRAENHNGYWVDEHFELMWRLPYMVEMIWEWKTYWLHFGAAKEFLEKLGVDTAPLKKLMEEKAGTINT